MTTRSMTGTGSRIRGMPIRASVLRTTRRALLLWAAALAAVSAIYVSFYPAMGSEMQAAIDTLPDALVAALGYDQLHTPGGYISSTVFGLLAPILLLVYAIGGGAHLIAGQEEDGTLELSLTGPVSRQRLFLERMLALWVNLFLLTLVVFVVTLGLVALLDIELPAMNILAGSTGLFLLVLGFGTLALSLGAASGRRGIALGVTAGTAVVAFMLDALAPVTGYDWMAAISPFSWYLGGEPLTEGFDPAGLLKLGLLTLVAVAIGLLRFPRRDLMV